MNLDERLQKDLSPDIYCLVHNKIVDIQQENEQLKGSMKTYDILLKSNVEENKQLKDNWNKLKEYLESKWEESQDIWYVKIINKMQELEQGNDK